MSRTVVTPADRNKRGDIYLSDTMANRSLRLTRSATGGDPDGRSYHPAISGGGRFVAFVSEASNLTPESTGHVPQVYVKDLVTGITELISHTARRRPANGASLWPVLSRDGSRAAYQSVASNLLCHGGRAGQFADINLLWDVFLHDRTTGRTSRVSSNGGEDWLENIRN